jgi:hypothetical protein
MISFALARQIAQAHGCTQIPEKESVVRAARAWVKDEQNEDQDEEDARHEKFVETWNKAIDIATESRGTGKAVQPMEKEFSSALHELYPEDENDESEEPIPKAVRVANARITKAMDGLDEEQYKDVLELLKKAQELLGQVDKQ